MYDCFRTLGPESAIYFVTLVMFGSIIMLNLFLAILLGNFDRARVHQAKEKLIRNFSELIHKGYELEKCIKIILPDIPKHMSNFLLDKQKPFAPTKTLMVPRSKNQ